MSHKNTHSYQPESSQSSVQSDEQPNQANSDAESNDGSNYEGEDDRSNLSDSLDGSNQEVHKNQIKSEDENDSLEEDSSDGEERYFQNTGYHNKIHTIREDPEEGQEDESIDYIEQRIKKLEMDLEDRLLKHQPQVQKSKKQGKIVSKASALPPNPQRKNQNSQNKMNFMNSVHKPENVQFKKAEQKQSEPLIIPANIPKPKKTVVKQTFSDVKVESKVESKGSVEVKRQKVKKETSSKSDIKIEQILTELAATDNRICELQMAIKQLRVQNQVLKQKLDAQKVKSCKPKSKIGEGSGKVKPSNQKLEKQIELLDVIQKLQVKLKRSINRKLSVQSNGASLLLQKGTPLQVNH